MKNVVSITFDSRNHGDRIVDASRNLDWASDPPNASFPSDMYSMMLGNLYDIKLLMDMLPIYMQLEGVQVTFGIVGISFGAHSALLTIANEPRIKFAISVVGCANYEKLLNYRSPKADVSQHLDISEPLRLLLRGHDPIYRIESLSDKSILLLGGRNDELVPPSMNAEFVKLANQKQIDCEEMIDEEAGHALTALMNEKIIDWLQKRF